MISGSIARRYAKALLQIGVDARNYDALSTEIESAAAAYESSEELQHLLQSPSFPVAQRRAVLEEIVRRLALSPVVRNFLMLLLDRNRIVALPAIAREHRALADQQAGRVRAIVTTARPLTPMLEARLKAALERRTGKIVQLDKREDPSLLGGVVAQVGDIVYDGSVRAQLARVREALTN